MYTAQKIPNSTGYQLFLNGESRGTIAASQLSQYGLSSTNLGGTSTTAPTTTTTSTNTQSSTPQPQATGTNKDISTEYATVQNAVKSGALSPEDAILSLQGMIRSGQFTGSIDKSAVFPQGFSYKGTDGSTYTYQTAGGTPVRTTASTYSSNTGSQGTTGGNTPPKPQPTGNPTLDAAQNAQYQYVIGSLTQGYSINPALSGTTLASLLPQFIQETSQQLMPELQQSFQTEMQGVKQSLETLSTQYKATQGSDIYNFQTNLANLLNTANPYSAATGASARAMAENENRTLESLDATYAQQTGNVLQGAGAAFGQGAPSQSGYTGFTAGSVQPPTSNPLRVGVSGGNTVLAGSTNSASPLNFNYNPSIYTYGSIPTKYGTDFGNTINQLYKNYQGGAAATPTGQITSSSGLTL